MAVSIANKISAHSVPKTVVPKGSRASLSTAKPLRLGWVTDVVAAVTTGVPVSQRMLVCGVPEEVEAVASGLAESYSVMVQDDYESPVAFADRTAGDDCDDQIGAVVFLNRSLDQHGALLASANLRAVLDRCFHDAPVIVVAGEQAEGASGPGVDRILAV